MRTRGPGRGLDKREAPGSLTEDEGEGLRQCDCLSSELSIQGGRYEPLGDSIKRSVA